MQAGYTCPLERSICPSPAELGRASAVLRLQGGCSEPNDGVTDTAEEATAQFGCPSPAPNSCPNKPANQPLLDPITNFMVRTRTLISTSAFFRVDSSCKHQHHVCCASNCSTLSLRLVSCHVMRTHGQCLHILLALHSTATGLTAALHSQRRT